MEYTVELTMRTRDRLTKARLFDVAAIGGAASGHPGRNRLETTLTVDADDPAEACRRGIETVAAICPGTVIAVSAMTPAEHDRQLDQRLDLVAASEVADMLGVTRQRVHQLAKRDDFPPPVATLAVGAIWRASDLSTFAEGWQRKPGRPKISDK